MKNMIGELSKELAYRCRVLDPKGEDLDALYVKVIEAVNCENNPGIMLDFIAYELKTDGNTIASILDPITGLDIGRAYAFLKREDREKRNNCYGFLNKKLFLKFLLDRVKKIIEENGDEGVFLYKNAPKTQEKVKKVKKEKKEKRAEIVKEFLGESDLVQGDGSIPRFAYVCSENEEIIINVSDIVCIKRRNVLKNTVRIMLKGGHAVSIDCNLSMEELGKKLSHESHFLKIYLGKKKNN